MRGRPAGLIAKKEIIMFEQSNGIDAAQNAGQGGSLAPSHQVETSGSNGRFYSQAELNQMMLNVKRDAEAKMLRLEQEQPQYYQQKYRANMDSYQENQRGRYNDDLSEMKKQIKDDLLKEQYAQQQQFHQNQEKMKLEKTISTWEDKKRLGTQKYQDFTSIVNENDLAMFPHIFRTVVDNIDNAEDVLYELAKDPEKLMLYEAQRKNEFEKEAQSGVKSEITLRMLNKISKDAKEKMTKNTNQDANNGVNMGFRPQANNSYNSQYLQNETNSYLDNIGSSAVLSADRTGPVAVSDFEKMFKGQF